jgi:OOP family OmpA-OmpF porin
MSNYKPKGGKTMKRAILTMLFVTMFLGLTAMETKAAEVVFKTETVEVSGVKMELTKTADNFIILYDASSSMKGPLGNTGKRKIEAQKQILKERNDAFPELSLNAGLYTFTIGTGGIKRKVLKAYYPMKPYNKVGFGKAVEQLPTKASGATYLQPALRELDPILGGLSGRTVVFIYTDGSYSRWSGEFSSPLEIARELANKHDVCFYLISNAEGAAQKALLKDMASINACSRVVSFKEYLENNEYQSGALFVINERVFTEMLTQEKVAGLDTRNIIFDFDQSDVKPEFNSEMHALGEFLQDHPEAEVMLIGHADSVGDAEYNLGLSRRRAETVADYLVRNFNLDEERISVLWYGSAAPVASNDTLEGRRKNRRVVSLVSGLQ